MKRVLAMAVLLAAVVAVVVVLATGGDDNGTYRVRAIFMNAFSVIRGEDVKIAGVKVGRIESLDVTPDKKAAVVLRIDKSGFDDFRADAECTIRPQSLIGEKFVECTPTQPRPENAQKPPPLRKITRGPGKGQYLLPVSQTSRPVDLDLVNNIFRLPYRERLTIILNELGTGLAGRGSDLRQAIVNADPALKETDRVLATLAAQNRTLAKLADNGDAILGPLARDRAHVAGFVTHANTVAQATAERAGALQENIALLPAFLRQLRPTMQRLGGLADEMTPVLSDLGDHATSINRFVEGLGPFSQAGIPAFQSLGEAADVGRPALVKSQPIITDVGKLATTAKPVANNLDALLTSVKNTGGIERLMDFLFYTASATNGFDSYGHYLRAGLILNTCSTYAITLAADCSANFSSGGEGSARAASAGTPGYEDTRRSHALRDMDALLRGKPLPADTQKSTPAAQSAPPAAAPPVARSTRAQAARPLLDYLLGGDG